MILLYQHIIELFISIFLLHNIIIYRYRMSIKHIKFESNIV